MHVKDEILGNVYWRCSLNLSFNLRTVLNFRCFVPETLRKYPIVAALPRVCSKDYPIPGTNNVIKVIYNAISTLFLSHNFNLSFKKGVGVFIPVIGFHRDERYFENPDTFNPDRFNEANSEGKNQINRPYLPFGDGPRNCIGMRMGKMQTIVGLFQMFQHFRYELGDNLKNHDLKFDARSILLKPLDGIKLRIFKRT